MFFFVCILECADVPFNNKIVFTYFFFHMYFLESPVLPVGYLIRLISLCAFPLQGSRRGRSSNCQAFVRTALETLLGSHHCRHGGPPGRQGWRQPQPTPLSPNTPLPWMSPNTAHPGWIKQMGVQSNTFPGKWSPHSSCGTCMQVSDFNSHRLCKKFLGVLLYWTHQIAVSEPAPQSRCLPGPNPSPFAVYLSLPCSLTDSIC